MLLLPGANEGAGGAGERALGLPELGSGSGLGSGLGLGRPAWGVRSARTLPLTLGCAVRALCGLPGVSMMSRLGLVPYP